MDLEQITEKPNIVVMDKETYLENVEDIAYLDIEADRAFSNLDQVMSLSENYATILDNADKESITANQLTSLRASIVAGVTVGNGDAKKLLGIDVENHITVPSSSLQFDMEGIKEFVKKTWEKFKTLLVKANAFFKKLFLKILNAVSMRKGTIEKLEEEVGAASTIRSEIKSSKLAIKLALVNFYDDKFSDKIDVGSYTKIKNYEAIKDTRKGMESAVKALDKRVKDIKEYVGSNENMLVPAVKFFNEIDKGMMQLANLKKITNNSRFPKLVTTFITGTVIGKKVYGIGIDPGSDTMKVTGDISLDKVSSVTGIKQASLVSLLKAAGEVNDDFKSITDDTFSLVGDVMDISDTLGDIVMSNDAVKLSDAKKKQFSKEKKDMKNIISLTPWLAYKQVMGVYKEVGAVISLAKEALKDKK